MATIFSPGDFNINDFSDSEENYTDSSAACDDTIYDTSKNRCFMVYDSQLCILFKRCFRCGSLVDSSLIRELGSKGSQLYLNYTCSSGCSVKWKSQPDTAYIKGQGNLDITAAVTFAGIPVAKFEQFAWILNLKFMHNFRFYRLRKNYVVPVIHDTWQEDHRNVVAELIKDGKVVLIGDGRCDSPGHSAKYGTYTLMVQGNGKIADTAVVSVTDVSL